MKIILRSIDIPLESTVSKVTGTKEYIIKDRIRIFGDDSKRELLAIDGTRLLISDRGDANSVTAETELIWHTDVDTLKRYLHLSIHGDDD